MPKISYLGAPFTVGKTVAVVVVMPSGIKRIFEFDEAQLTKLFKNISEVMYSFKWQSETVTMWLGAYKAADGWRSIASDSKPEPNWWLTGETM